MMFILLMTYYDEISSGYDELHKEEQLRKIDLIKRYIHPQPGDLLLDVGCGTGISTADWNCEAYGLDTSSKLLDLAVKGPKYIVGAAESIPFSDNYFDYVLAITSIHNFSDIRLAISEMQRVCKNTLVVTILKSSSSYDTIVNLISPLQPLEIDEEKDTLFIIAKFKKT